MGRVDFIRDNISVEVFEPVSGGRMWWEEVNAVSRKVMVDNVG